MLEQQLPTCKLEPNYVGRVEITGHSSYSDPDAAADTLRFLSALKLIFQGSRRSVHNGYFRTLEAGIKKLCIKINF